MIVLVVILLGGCGKKPKDQGYINVDEPYRIEKLEVQVKKTELREWDPNAKQLVKNLTPHHMFNIELQIMQITNRDFVKIDEVGFYGWIDHQSRLDSKNVGTLCDELGQKFTLLPQEHANFELDKKTFRSVPWSRK